MGPAALQRGGAPTAVGDLETAFDAKGDGSLAAPGGETATSVFGQGTSSGFFFALSIPIDLRPDFGVSE